MKDFTASLKFVYQAKTESEAEDKLFGFQQERENKYPLVVKP